ncbi:MAG: polyprenyl synthetase family protein [Thermodesulfobacteriota bacterium]
MENLKNKVLNAIAPDLEEIEKAVKRNLSPHLELVKLIAEHILFSGGKRLRPVLMLMGSRICGKDTPDLYDYSIIFEYLHSATLLHDDLVDNAALRRGSKAAHKVYGASEAVLAGDFLLARSLSIASSLKDPEIVNEVAKITEDMSQGEIHQLINKGDFKTTESVYYDIIKRKTAVLIEGACRTGARIAKADEEKVSILGEYGYNLGIAFQMADDLLDYISDADALGKNSGADLREGKLTLPLIHAMENCSEKEKTFLDSQIRNALNGIEPDFPKVLSVIEQYSGLSYTQKVAQKHVNKARQVLSVFPDSKEKEILFMLADYSVSRSV